LQHVPPAAWIAEACTLPRQESSEITIFSSSNRIGCSEHKNTKKLNPLITDRLFLNNNYYINNVKSTKEMDLTDWRTGQQPMHMKSTDRKDDGILPQQRRRPALGRLRYVQNQKSRIDYWYNR